MWEDKRPRSHLPLRLDEEFRRLLVKQLVKKIFNENLRVQGKIFKRYLRRAMSELVKT